jgi:diketogulonate reductase-like aldo/keto reductase
MKMGIKDIIVWRIIPGLAVAIAAAAGFFLSHEFPFAFIFATVVPLSYGVLPPSVVGHGKMRGTPEVPSDLMPLPRPKDELFLDLPGGGKLPQQGIGMCCRATATDDVLVYRTVLWYLLLGGRHIDGAHVYWNHAAIGRGIAEAIRRGVPREEIFVTTKIFPTHFGFESTKENVRNYLRELGLEYIDMVLLHWPQNFPLLSSPCQKEGKSRSECRRETWRALSDLREEGLIKNAGVSNFSLKHIKEFEGFGAPIANNQISFHPFEPDHVMETVKYCQSNGITVTAYSPLG